MNPNLQPWTQTLRHRFLDAGYRLRNRMRQDGIIRYRYWRQLSRRLAWTILEADEYGYVARADVLFLARIERHALGDVLALTEVA